MSDLSSVVVVGASLAGLHAARALRRRGFDGTLTLVGAEAHPPYDRPPLSKQVLAGDWEPDRIALASPADDDLDLTWRLGAAATGLDVADRRVRPGRAASRSTFDGLVIATGARPRRLGDGGRAGVHVLRTLDDCLALRADLDAGPEPGRGGRRRVHRRRGGGHLPGPGPGGHPGRAAPRPPRPGAAAARWARPSAALHRDHGRRPPPRRRASTPSRAATGSSGCGCPTAPPSTATWWWSASAWCPPPAGWRAPA